MINNQKPHLSASQIDTFCRCPEQYRRRYIEREVIPPGIALLKGAAVHKGAEANFRQKIETHTDLPIVDIVAASVDAFESAKAGGITLSDEEVSRGMGVVFGEAVDAVADMARVHAEKQAPEYQPAMIEQQVRIELPHAPRDLLGVIDLADDRDRIVDFKTAAKRKSQADADDNIGLTVYAASFQALTGREPESVRLDVIVKGKRETARQIVETNRKPADFQALANRINVVNKSIDAGLFPPAPPGAWWCSSRFCGYHSTCPYVNSERKQRSENGE